MDSINVCFYFGHLEKVKFLVEHGADINAKDNESKTSIMLASEKGYLAMVKYLFEKGADLSYHGEHFNDKV